MTKSIETTEPENASEAASPADVFVRPDNCIDPDYDSQKECLEIYMATLSVANQLIADLYNSKSTWVGDEENKLRNRASKYLDGRLTIKDRKTELIDALENAKLFAEWVECLGRTDCEVYKDRLQNRADLAISRIDKALDHQ